MDNYFDGNYYKIRKKTFWKIVVWVTIIIFGISLLSQIKFKGDNRGERIEIDYQHLKSKLDNVDKCCLCGNNARSLMGYYCKFDTIGVISLNDWYYTRTVTKKSFMYIVMLFSWAILLSFFIPSVIYEYQIANTDNIYVLTLLTLNAFFISYFWLNGTKDIVYVVFFYVFKKRIFSYSERIKNQKKCFSNAKVLLVYCTCNDFEESSLKKCIKQSHKNTKTIILDDSDDIGYPIGTRVELVSMNDPFTKLMPGEQGTVQFVDDIGTVFVNWDCGSGLGVAYGEDVIRKI